MERITSRTLRIGAMTASMIGAAAQCHAAGFYLQEQSVKGLGRAFSGEVSDQGPESLWWNPASIAGSTKGSAYLGASAIMPRAHVDDTGTLIIRPGQAPAPVGGNPFARNPAKSGVLPSGAVSMPLNDRVAFGLALTSGFSFTTNYAADSWVRYTADRTKLRTIDIQPSIALAVTDWLGVGAGPNIEYSKATLSNALPNLLAALPDGEQSLTGDGWNVGWTAGFQAHQGPVTVGFSYKSSIRHVLDGQVAISGLLGPLAGNNGVIPTKARFRTPWQAIVGARYKATDRLALNFQAVRLGWGKFDAIALGAPINQAIPEAYHNSWSFAGGADYELTPRWTIRAGVMHDQTPTVDGSRDARVPDSSRWNYAAGASFQLCKAFTIDAGGSYISFKDAPIDRTTAAFAGTAVQTPILVSGELHDAHAIVLALGGRVTF